MDAYSHLVGWYLPWTLYVGFTLTAFKLMLRFWSALALNRNNKPTVASVIDDSL